MNVPKLHRGAHWQPVETALPSSPQSLMHSSPNSVPTSSHHRDHQGRQSLCELLPELEFES